MPAHRSVLVDGWEDDLIEVRAGDTVPIVFTFLEDGSPATLVGASAGKIYWMNTYYWDGVNRYGPPYEDLWGRYTESDDEGEALSLSGAADGVATFSPSSTSFDKPGDYYVMLSYERAGALRQYPTVPGRLRLRVHPSLARNSGVQP